MKTFTKLISLMIAVMMVFALALPTFATDDGSRTITINGKEAGHTYEAYQVFKGTYKEIELAPVYIVDDNGTYYYNTETEEYVLIAETTLSVENISNFSGGELKEDGSLSATEYAQTIPVEKVLTNIEWGDGVNGPALLAELKGIDDVNSPLYGKFTFCEGAEDVAEVIKLFGDDSNAIKAFAEIAANNKKDPAQGTTSQSEPITIGDVTTYRYVIDNLSDGYYLVIDKNSETSETPNEDITSYSKYMLELVGDNVTIEPKVETPTLTKKILVTNADGTISEVEVTDANIGDTINYKLVSKVPNMEGYESYTFQVVDTMSEGLDFNNDDVVVMIGDTRLHPSTNTETDREDAFTVTTLKDSTGNTVITIEVLDFIQYKDQTGKDIVVTYSADLNEKAVNGNTGNLNTAKLIYSKDPYNPDITGETPDSKTKTYVTEITIEKVDGSNHNTHLTGAVFKISGLKNVDSIVNGVRFEEDASGTYYKLKDDKYTETPPTPNTEDLYESTTTKYKKVAYSETIEGHEQFVATGTVDENGYLTFSGLGSGIYTITEITAPNGYNLLKEPITVEITFTPDGEQKWIYTVKNGENIITDDNLIAIETDGTIKLVVENNKGSELPSTGGIGTTIFYVLGGILAVGAVVLLVTKKRMREDV